MNRLLRIISVALITAGVVIAVDVGVTLAWGEPISALLTKLNQEQAESELAEIETEFATSVEPDVGASGTERGRARALARAFESELRDGRPIGRIKAPAMKADYVFVEGTGTDALRTGPGHYPSTELPGAGGTVAIAGHRTTYGAPFGDIEDMQAGDVVELRMPYGSFTYRVTNTRIVEPTATGIIRDVGRERLVLTACHPRYSAAQRIAVFADLDDIRLPSVTDEGPPSSS